MEIKDVQLLAKIQQHIIQRKQMIILALVLVQVDIIILQIQKEL
jgi:hypothetical protein